MASKVTDIWVWDPVDGEKFQHPGELPTSTQASNAFFFDKIFGPKLAKISRASLLDRKGGLSMIAREDGSTHEVPTNRVLPWYEGLLILQQIEASAGNVPWFTERLREILEQERSKRSKFFILASSVYVEKKLLQQAVTGASYIDHNDQEHNFRRDTLNPDDKPDEDDPLDGFWKVKDVLAYMPPWEAFCNQRCGLYQEFYKVRWENFEETDFSNVENGCTDPGSTWEPDECLPPHLDVFRLREKKTWITQRKDQEAKEELAKAEKAAENRKAGKRKETEVSEPPAKMSRFRRDGKPLVRDVFRLSFGHDFKPDPLDDRNDTIRMGWPRRPEEYPPGFGVAAPPGFCHAKCDCMDDQRGQKPWETSKSWLEQDPQGPQRAADALKMVTTFSEQSRLVRRRGQVSKQVYLESVQHHPAEDTQCKAALYLAKEVETQIHKALKDLPLDALMDGNDEVRIPSLAFMKPGEDYAPVRYLLSPDSSARSWAKISPENGVLSATMGPPSRQAPVTIELYHPEVLGGASLGAVIDCTVTTSSKPVWRSATASLIASFRDVQKCPLTRNARIIWQERMSKIYDFENRLAKEDITFGEWLSCMELALRLLRSLAFANLVKSEVQTSRPPPRAVARAN